MDSEFARLLDLVPLAHVRGDAVESLLDAAFGADRHGRTAYRVRAGMTPVTALSFAAQEDGRPVGSIQCWPVALHADAGGALPLVMVGPVAVAPERQNAGIGRALMARTLQVADHGRVLGGDALMLIGDPEYYARFGFDATATGGWRLPGPFEPRRLLARGNAPALTGSIGPR